MQRRSLVLVLALLTLSWLFPPWTSYQGKATPLGLSFVLAPPSGRGVEVDFGRLLLLDASLCVVGLAVARVRGRHLALAARVGLWSTAGVMLVGLAGISINSRLEAHRKSEQERRDNEVQRRNAERQRNSADRVLSDEEALRYLGSGGEWTAEDFKELEAQEKESEPLAPKNSE